MAENFHIDIENKEAAYSELLKAYQAVIEGENNVVAKMATLNSMIYNTFKPRFFWCGFYVVEENEENQLIVGPYQGTLGCLRIPFSKGVCGKAARDKAIQIVDDVHEIEDHIACDSNSNSEIVVPVFDNNGNLRAVLDIDSTQFAAFDKIDANGLSDLVKLIF